MSQEATYYQRNRELLWEWQKNIKRASKEQLKRIVWRRTKYIQTKYERNRYPVMSEEKEQRLREYQRKYHIAKIQA